MNLSRRTLIIVCVLCAFSLVSGCASQTQGSVDELEAEISRLQNKVSELEAEISHQQSRVGELEAEIARTVDYENHCEALLRELFSEDELMKLALERGMVYHLRVGEVPVTDPEVTVSAGDMISVTVSEGMVMRSDDSDTLLPNTILQQVMLDDLADHIEIVESDAEFFDSPAAGTVVWGYGFFFEDAAPGSVIRVEISETLRDRLGLDFCEFTVEVTKP